MTEEEKKTILGDLYEKLGKASQANHHQSVLDHTDKSKYLVLFIKHIIVLQVDSSQDVAVKARLTALIKTKNFE